MSCTICTEQFTATAGAAALPCGHAFHEPCVRQWFAARKPTTCPTCRKRSGPTDLIPHLFITFPANGLNATMELDEPSSPLLRQVFEAKEELASAQCLHRRERGEWQHSLERMERERDKAKKDAASAKKELAAEKRIRSVLATEMEGLRSQAKELADVKSKYKSLKAKSRLTSALNSGQWLEKSAILDAGESREALAELVIILQSKLAKAHKEKDEAVMREQKAQTARALAARRLSPPAPTAPAPPRPSLSSPILHPPRKLRRALSSQVQSPTVSGLPGARKVLAPKASDAFNREPRPVKRNKPNIAIASLDDSIFCLDD